jgi:hypothetical protein
MLKTGDEDDMEALVVQGECEKAGRRVYVCKFEDVYVPGTCLCICVCVSVSVCVCECICV